jgi:regulation of enolase protein 1 (concanavalin A-like superfamily)
VNGDTAASLSTPPTLTTAATASSAAGNYAIAPSGAAAANYTLSYAAGTLAVQPAALTITADDASKLYGAALPALTARYSGFVNGDTAASLSTPPTLTTVATASSAAGNYAVTPSGAAAANYTLSYTPGMLVVLPLPTTNEPPSVALTAPTNGASFEASASLTLTANATDADGTIAKVEFFTGAAKLGEVTSSPYALTWNNAGVGNYSLTAVATDNSGAVTTSGNVAITVVDSTALPAPWMATELGTVTANCTATHTSGSFTVKGGGSRIAQTSDNLWYMHQAAAADFVLTARVDSQSATASGARAGVMIRETLDSSSREVFMGLAPASSNAEWVRRSSPGAKASITTVTRRKAPYWVRLSRTGTTLTGFISPDGSKWTRVAAASVSLPANVLAGLAVCSGSSGATNTVIFANVALTSATVPAPPAATDPLPPFPAPAVIQNFMVSPEGADFVITGEEGTYWLLEDSADHNDWRPLQTLTLVEGMARHTEAATTAPNRFFRLQQAR